MISNRLCIELNLDNFKGNFLNILFFFAPSDSRFSNRCISTKYCPILTKAYLFSFQMMYKSQFQEIDPYDWFCGPGSHIELLLYLLISKIVVLLEQLFQQLTVTRTHTFILFLLLLGHPSS